MELFNRRLDCLGRGPIIHRRVAELNAKLDLTLDPMSDSGNDLGDGFVAFNWTGSC